MYKGDIFMYNIEPKYQIDDYKMCGHCEKHFIPSHQHRIYCSKACFDAVRIIKRRLDSKTRYVKNKTCKHCGDWCLKANYYSGGCCNKPECIEEEKNIEEKNLSVNTTIILKNQ